MKLSIDFFEIRAGNSDETGKTQTNNLASLFYFQQTSYIQTSKFVQNLKGKKQIYERRQ